jgi:hypothetical protein
MRRFILAVVCYLTVITSVAQAQSPSSGIKPIHVPAGTVLTFYLQTRLNPASGNALDLLPKGTILSVKILDSIDSDVNRDGSEFRGLVVSPLVSRDEVVIHTDAEVRGLFALLRSRNHPDGFRYELLITGISDGGKTFQLTASLNPSFLDGGSQPTSSSKTNSNSTAPTTPNDGSSSAMHK